MTHEGRAKLLDFGLAKRTGPPRDSGIAHSLPRAANRSRDGAGDGRIHVPGTGAGRGGGSPLGHLLLRRRAVRNAVRAAGFPARYGRGNHDRDPERGPAGDRGRRLRSIARSATDRPTLPRKEARRALSVRPGHRFRPAGRLWFHGRGPAGGGRGARTEAAGAGSPRSRPRPCLWPPDWGCIERGGRRSAARRRGSSSGR